MDVANLDSSKAFVEVSCDKLVTKLEKRGLGSAAAWQVKAQACSPMVPFYPKEKWQVGYRRILP